MGGKKNAKKIKLPKVQNWILVIFLFISLFLTATFYRFDHLKMNELKYKVSEADLTAKNPQDIYRSLNELKKFTTSHTVISFLEQNGVQKIILGSGPVYLEHQYRRDASKAIKIAESSISEGNPHGNVFAQAMSICKPQAIRYGWQWNSKEYLSCMTDEINKHPSSKTLEDQLVAKIPNSSLYRYDFSSPIWSFSLSGFFSLISLTFIVVIFTKIVIWILLRLTLLFI